jgi:tRNA1(Val) A37 N6-methylase TrmN6
MPTTQDIYVLNKRLKLRHSAAGFKTSMDSVLLAAACPAMAGERLLDMGCGVGGAGLCVLARMAGVHLTGVEIQKDHADLAEYNAAVHDFADQTDFINIDIRQYRAEKAFHHVICNPPYLEAERHLRSPSAEKAMAMGHSEETMTVKDWIDTAHFCLKSKGSLTMIHRADHLDKIIQALGKRFGAVEIFPFWPRHGEQASRVIVRAFKDRYSPMKMHAGLALHGDKQDRNYTAQTEKILRDGERLF